MRDQNGGELGGRINVIFIDLLTIRKLVGTPTQKLTPLQKWGLYLSYADDESKRDYISQIAQSEEGIMEADRIAQTMSEEDANWFRQNSRQQFWEDYYAGMNAAKENGFEQGLEQGVQQKAIEAARSFYANGVSVETIAKSLNITIEEVQKILNETVVEEK